jgi:SAM-dependent methyltransferase
MNDAIAAAAEIIRGPRGDPFVRLMAEAYQTLASPSGDCHFAPDFLRLASAGCRGAGDNGWDPALKSALAEAEEIGLIKTGVKRPELTPPGFLIGNVAKEYCYYVQNGRQLPFPKPPLEMVAGRDVLDVGCSCGLWLWEFQRNARSAVGVESQEEYAVLGRALSEREGFTNPKIMTGWAEQLNKLTQPHSFDLIFSRFALNYMKVRSVVAMMAEALRPGGFMWIQVGVPRLLPRELFTCNVSWRRKGFMLLEMLNLPMILAGRQLSISTRGRMHHRHNPVNPPLWWWRKELGRNGLTDFRVIASGQSLVFCARKQPAQKN